MKLCVIESHNGEGKFPTFSKGSVIKNLALYEKYPNWYACQINGYDTYVPIDFITNDTLNQNYNPTELQIKKGEVVELLALYYQWAYVKYQDQNGWLPCHILRSIMSLDI
ncbi:hypothetical protein A6A10_08685 [Otariodibacter oris]|nr:hypothetical protein A6A10_08685 [Otariodibacter oris]